MENCKFNLNIPFRYFNNICRVCLTKARLLIPIHEVNLTHNMSGGPLQHISLTEVFQKYCGITVSVDDKPQRICESCMYGIGQAYNVFQLFSQSNSILDAELNKCQLKKQIKQERYLLKGQTHEISNYLSSDVSLVSQDSLTNTSNPVTFVDYLDKENSDSDNHLTILPEHKFEISKKDPDLFLDLTIETNNININNDHQSKAIPEHKMDTSLDMAENNVVYELKPKPYRPRLKSPPRFIDPRGLLSDHTYSISEKALLRLFQRRRKKMKASKPKRLTKTNIWKVPKILQPKTIKKQELKNFKCRFCDIEFEEMGKVIEHLEENHRESNRCILCPKIFTRYDFMLKHVLAHSNHGAFCSRCFIYFKDKESFQRHKESEEHKKLIPCKICNKGYVSYYRLKIHIEGMHDSGSKRRYQCSECGLMVRWKHNLTRHMKTHRDLATRKTFLCQFCANSFIYISTLNHHVKTVHGEQSHLERTSSKSPEPTATASQSKANDTFQCEICADLFNLKSRWFEHRLTHPGVPVNCPYCEKVLDNPKEFKEHRKLEHSSFVCNVCQTGLPTADRFYRHRCGYHKQVGKTFGCSECNAIFLNLQNLKTHKLTHSGKRPYKCEYCGKCFVQSAHKRQHIACMHVPHKRFKCKTCGKAFLFKSVLTNHMRSHTGEKPFICPYCSKPYRDTTARHKHVKHDHPDQMANFLDYKRQHQEQESESAKALYKQQ